MDETEHTSRLGDALTNFELITPTRVRRGEPVGLVRKELRTGYLDAFDLERLDILRRQYHLARALDARITFGGLFSAPSIANRKAEDILEFVCSSCSREGFLAKIVKTQYREVSAPVPSVTRTEEEPSESEIREFFTRVRARMMSKK